MPNEKINKNKNKKNIEKTRAAFPFLTSKFSATYITKTSTKILIFHFLQKKKKKRKGKILLNFKRNSLLKEVLSVVQFWKNKKTKICIISSKKKNF